MRFLYGDSTPFPLGDTFLTTLEAFMASTTRIVELDGEARALASQVAEGAEARQRGLEALEGFHNVVMRAVSDTAQKVEVPARCRRRAARWRCRAASSSPRWPRLRASGRRRRPPGSPSGSPPPDVPVASGSNRVLSGS